MEDFLRLSLCVSGGQRQVNVETLSTLDCGVRSDSVPMEDAVEALQQQVNALMAQNATLEAQLLGQQNIAQGLAELLGAITAVLNRAQAPTRRMLC